MKAFLALAALLCAVSGAPIEDVVEERGILGVAPAVGVASSSYAGEQFSQGAKEAAQQQGQGSFGYNHGGQASKVAGNKESFGSKENFNFANSNSYNQGSGFNQGSGAFNQAGHSQGFQQNQHGYQVPVFGIPGGVGGVIPGAGGVIPGAVGGIGGYGAVPYQYQGGVVPSVPIIPSYGGASAASGFSQGQNAAGQFQGAGAYSYNQGHSSSTGSGNKETYGNKESFAAENQAGHAIGGGQQSHASGFDKGQHASGSQVHSQQQSAVPVF